ncbi:MAG: PaaI family thioesterase [Desulfobacterales bacterium]|nr:PaaI family thioesterase [Desulfobacterales bacterium]
MKRKGDQLNIQTHQKIDKTLCGTPVFLDEGISRVEFTATGNMIADDTGLVHGGFIFGLADYAAMIAVNHPNVVLGAAQVKFLKPVKIDETVEAVARIEKIEGKKHEVFVEVKRADEAVFQGSFTCFALPQHVLG